MAVAVYERLAVCWLLSFFVLRLLLDPIVTDLEEQPRLSLSRARLGMSRVGKDGAHQLPVIGDVAVKHPPFRFTASPRVCE